MNKKDVLDALQSFMDGNGLKFEYDDEASLFKGVVGMKCALRQGGVLINVGDDYFVVYLVSPVKGNPENLGELMKYLTMANFGLTYGNFELDVSDGEVRFKSFVNCSGLAYISPSWIRDGVFLSCSMLERYGNGIAALAAGESDAETEIAKAEEQDR